MDFQKARIALRYWLQGAGWHDALIAMDAAERVHLGLRKDGTTPEFAHQVSIAQFVRTLTPSLIHPEATMATVFLHDVPEDYGIRAEEVTRGFRSPDVAAFTLPAVEALTKTFRGAKRLEAAVFDAIARDPVASIVKPADRIDNQGSMVGVFTLAKQKSYIAETEAFILPALKEAKRRFPEQELAYENLKAMLGSQIALLGAVHAVLEREPDPEPEEAPSP
jgi:(p)ppGpp synthase/HD superfamily hydrolase